jgi:BlaI family penicillinase repressor
MKNMPRISDAEWEVMKVLWEKNPLSANEVVDHLSASTDWNHRTIRTLLNRLVKKRALGFRIDGKRYLFIPKVSKEECVRYESEGFIARVFNGEASPLLAHFVKQKSLSKSDIQELKRILDDKESI